jgi:hypothetical protein
MSFTSAYIPPPRVNLLIRIARDYHQFKDMSFERDCMANGMIMEPYIIRFGC